MSEARRYGRTVRAITLGAVLLAQGSALVARTGFVRADPARGGDAAAVLLAGVRGLPPAGPPEIVGTLEGYADGAIVVLTTVGFRHVRLDADTVVARPHGRAVFADLRPGAVVMVWGRRALLDGGVRARAVLVTDS